MEKKRPFLKWAGNKYHCLHHILESLPPGKRLIEPFAGSGAVFLNTQYPNYLLAEGNKDLVSLYTCLQKEGEPFIKYCKRLFTSENNSEKKYYALREEFNSCQKPRKRAALFLYLNRHGYNGLCRYNQSGIYNVPFGRYVNPYFPYKEMLFFAEKSQSTQFIHKDFRDTINMAEPGDIIYCDPPYAPINQETNFTAYIHKAFGEGEQIHLAELARETAAKGIPVLISNHDNAFTRHHYQHSDIKSFKVRRFISCKGSQRQFVKELLAVFSRGY